MISALGLLEQALIVIAALCALVLVHEFGHFVVAKLSKMRVDEFGLGFPPRAMTLGKIGETTYTLNWLPLGGFVKIHGEDGGDEQDPRSFAARPRILQAFVLVAGIAMNFLFAFVLISAALMAGTPRALSQNELAHARDVHVAVTAVLPNSPAAKAGLQPGDEILRAQDAQGTWAATSTASFADFVNASRGTPISLSVQQAAGGTVTATATPVAGLVSSDPSRYVLGVDIYPVGVTPVPFFAAIAQGATLTWGVTVLTVHGLWQLISGLFTFSADLSQVSGPIGIVSHISSASSQGFGDLFSLIAIISVNLALINLIPIPALDGGRLLFVAIEAVRRRAINPEVVARVNTIGFALLLLLVAVISVHDVLRLV